MSTFRRSMVFDWLTLSVLVCSSVVCVAPAKANEVVQVTADPSKIEQAAEADQVGLAHRAEQAARSDKATEASAQRLSSDLTFEKKTFKFSGGLLVETLTSVNQDDGGRKNNSGFYALSLGVEHVPESISASLKIPYSREYTYERDDGTDGDFSNILYSAKKTYKPAGYFSSLSLSIGGGIPAGREAVRSTFRGSVGPGVALKKTLGRFTVGQSGAYRYSFFEYDIQDDGVINSPHNLTSVTDVEMKINESLTVSASFNFMHFINFQGSGRNSTWSILSLDYSILENLSASVGLSTLKGTQTADGQSEQITYYDPDSSQLFLDLNFSF